MVKELKYSLHTENNLISLCSSIPYPRSYPEAISGLKGALIWKGKKDWKTNSENIGKFFPPFDILNPTFRTDSQLHVWGLS
jgi:hypothetical protein